MGMQKRGISPLIATVLLISMVVVISSIVFIWGSDFMNMLTEETGEKSLTDVNLLQNARMDVNVLVEGNEIKGNIVNIGTIDFESVKLNVVGTQGTETIVIQETISKGGARSFDKTFDYDNVGFVEEVIVVPVIDYGGESIAVSSVATKDESIEYYPFISTGENEIFSNIDRCSPNLYVLENDKIKFFVSTPPIRERSCSSGAYNSYAGVPMRIWAKNTHSSSYRRNNAIIDNTRLYIPGTATVGSMDRFNSKPDVLEVDFNQQGNLKPKIRYILKKGWNYVKVEFSVENVGSSIESVQLRWSGDNDFGGLWRNDEGEVNPPLTPIYSEKWIAAWRASTNDVYGIINKNPSNTVGIYSAWEGTTIKEDSATSLPQGREHTMTFYIMSDFKGPGGNEWKPVEDLYNSI